jgi:hypothetical protein
MSIIKRFKISPSVADPAGIYNTALVIITSSVLTDSLLLEELPSDIRLRMYQEASNVGR